MKRQSLSMMLLLLLSVASPALAGDAVTEWNAVAVEAVKTKQLTSPPAARALAMVHAAIYDAANAVERHNAPFHVDTSADAVASLSAAIAGAAHRVLVGLFPEQSATLNDALAAALAMIPDGEAKDEGLSAGSGVGDEIMEWRQSDGSAGSAMFMGGDAPGQWRPTPPAYAMGMMPHWATVLPFAMPTNDAFRLRAPPQLSTGRYAKDLETVRRLGAKDGSTRTAEETAIAMFWADSPGTITTVGRWNVVARQLSDAALFSVFENARLFALLNVALADAGIASWDSKYAYAFWRPVTAIREADDDGNPRTAADALWEPLLMTPAFPEYASAHSQFSGAAAEVLRRVYRSDDFAFSLASFSDPMVVRNYTSFSEAAMEAGQSRIFGGIHYPLSNLAGLKAGQKLARFVLSRTMRPTRAD
jgi:hypothetical protein